MSEIPFFDDHAVLESALPDHLIPELTSVANRLLASLDADQQRKLTHILEQSPFLTRQLIRALVGSQFLLDNVCRHPELLFNMLLSDAAYTSLTAVKIIDMVELSCCECETVEQLDSALRQLRRQIMAMIVWRDLNRLSTFSEVCQSMTALAETCIQQAANFHYRLLAEKHGVPIGYESATPQPLLVLGMGKLGGAELNVSSDIDLIFAYPESGETNHASRPLDNAQFFTRLGQRVIKSLHEVTAEGFVFRVDMRLRPYGQSGALVSTFAALENYYHTQGREWERFASIKARIVAITLVSENLPESSLSTGVAAFTSDNSSLLHQAQEQLEHILQPFTYRKYIDFSVIEALRKLKAMIVQEVRRKGMQTNIKLGAGGIRELEFIVQSFQLVRGGRDTQLQQRHWLVVLSELERESMIDTEVVDQLRAAYIFLRDVEHRLQAYQDHQTQELPVDSIPQAVLAWLMGFADWHHFAIELEQYRRVVSEQFQLVIAEPEAHAEQQTVEAGWSLLWLQQVDDNVAFLREKGCKTPEPIAEQLAYLLDSWSVKCLSAHARDALDELMPQVFVTVFELGEPDETLLRVLRWLEKIVSRSSYITLLLENPSVLKHLVVLFQGSVWIAELLAQMPSLLDELLDLHALYTLPTKEQLQGELHQQLLRVEPDDLESHMEVLRYFKLAHELRVAASELSGALALMNVSDYLTWIAEVVLAEAFAISWQQLVGKHGLPDGVEGEGGFAIVAYGKLGGIELNYSSDLDLVFLYDAEPYGMTQGERPVDSQTFYTRLGQKIIHMLNTRTLSGPLYEVDMRLRPSGNSGLLVSSIGAFARYQQDSAWTWEHQALVRARPVVGDASLCERFVQIRREILQRQRDPADLQKSVLEMRHKMRAHLGSGKSSSVKSSIRHADPVTEAGVTTETQDKKPLFHLKQDAGGIVDIEFMVQYAVLAWSHQQPCLVRYTDNIRILESLRESGSIDAEQAELLMKVYVRYRELSHRLALQKQSSLVDDVAFQEYELPTLREHIKRLWKQLLDADGS